MICAALSTTEYTRRLAMSPSKYHVLSLERPMSKYVVPVVGEHVLLANGPALMAMERVLPLNVIVQYDHTLMSTFRAAVAGVPHAHGSSPAAHKPLGHAALETVCMPIELALHVPSPCMAM
jgi:hypothetical protein